MWGHRKKVGVQLLAASNSENKTAEYCVALAGEWFPCRIPAFASTCRTRCGRWLSKNLRVRDASPFVGVNANSVRGSVSGLGVKQGGWPSPPHNRLMHSGGNVHSHPCCWP
jgi:hypothetical protein